MTVNVNGVLVDAVIAATPGAIVPNLFANGSDNVLRRDYAALTTANNIGDTITLGTFKSNTYLDPASVIWFDALGTGCQLNIGDANHTSGLASALAVAAAGNAHINKSFVPGHMGYPLWQHLGYASDPGGNITLIATIANAAPTSNGNVGWKLVGVQH